LFYSQLETGSHMPKGSQTCESNKNGNQRATNNDIFLLFILNSGCLLFQKRRTNFAKNRTVCFSTNKYLKIELMFTVFIYLSNSNWYWISQRIRTARKGVSLLPPWSEVPRPRSGIPAALNTY